MFNIIVILINFSVCSFNQIEWHRLLSICMYILRWLRHFHTKLTRLGIDIIKCETIECIQNGICQTKLIYMQDHLVRMTRCHDTKYFDGRFKKNHFDHTICVYHMVLNRSFFYTRHPIQVTHQYQNKWVRTYFHIQNNNTVFQMLETYLPHVCYGWE